MRKVYSGTLKFLYQAHLSYIVKFIIVLLKQLTFSDSRTAIDYGNITNMLSYHLFNDVQNNLHWKYSL